MNDLPRLRMFAGPNGSGKSTIKSVIRSELLSVYKDGQSKSMLRCSDAGAMSKPKHKDVAYFRGKEGQW